MLTIVQMFPLDTYAAISFSSWMRSSAPCTTVTPWTLVAEAGVSQAEDRFTVWAAGCAPFTPLAEGWQLWEKPHQRLENPESRVSGANATSDHSHQVLLGSAALGGPAPKDQFPDQFSRSVSPGSLLGGGTKCRMGDSPGNQGLTPFWPVEPCWNALVYKHCFDTSDIWK